LFLIIQSFIITIVFFVIVVDLFQLSIFFISNINIFFILFQLLKTELLQVYSPTLYYHVFKNAILRLSVYD